MNAEAALRIATAARLERAYRLALLLQGRLARQAPPADDAAAFEHEALAGELLALLDETRAALLARA